MDPATHPRLRLSLGVYGDTTARAHPEGPSYPVSYEWRGHEFEAVDVQWGTADQVRVDLPGEGPWLVQGIASGGGYYVLSSRLLDADGKRIPVMDGPALSSYAPPDSAGVVLTLDSEVPLDRFGAVVYAVSR